MKATLPPTGTTGYISLDNKFAIRAPGSSGCRTITYLGDTLFPIFTYSQDLEAFCKKFRIDYEVFQIKDGELFLAAILDAAKKLKTKTRIVIDPQSASQGGLKYLELKFN